MTATQLERIQYAKKQFIRAQHLGPKAKFISSIDACLKQTHQSESTLIENFALLRFELEGLIEENRKQIRFAAVISTMSKFEASKSGVFEAQLDVIAANILLSGNEIRQELECAEALLSSSNMELIHENNRTR